MQTFFVAALGFVAAPHRMPMPLKDARGSHLVMRLPDGVLELLDPAVKPQTVEPLWKEFRKCYPTEKAAVAAARRNVGPFIFFDHMGPVRFNPGQAIDVRPHPHIGLATVTYLFEGALMHRDSLGFVQRITPGDVNWMTAGHGIVHSERSPDAERNIARGLHGIQVWMHYQRQMSKPSRPSPITRKLRCRGSRCLQPNCG
jgi:hypothetical protein